LSFESQDVMHTFGSHRVYIHGIHKIKSFVSKGVTCKLCLQQLYPTVVREMNPAQSTLPPAEGKMVKQSHYRPGVAQMVPGS